MKKRVCNRMALKPGSLRLRVLATEPGRVAMRSLRMTVIQRAVSRRPPMTGPRWGIQQRKRAARPR